ncbi:hypothetical protein ILYODFUR_034176 [Ilyodon furcidens]|uniref:Uncharacterized protein n=1 Tax=Ilyodon furcidens TaxID=33524 RepID=A0ABV0TEK7_9TELE
MLMPMQTLSPHACLRRLTHHTHAYTGSLTTRMPMRPILHSHAYAGSITCIHSSFSCLLGSLCLSFPTQPIIHSYAYAGSLTCIHSSFSCLHRLTHQHPFSIRLPSWHNSFIILNVFTSRPIILMPLLSHFPLYLRGSTSSPVHLCNSVLHLFNLIHLIPPRLLDHNYQNYHII